MGVASVVGDMVAEGTDDRVVLACYRVRLLGEPVALFHARLKWVPMSQLGQQQTPPADRATIIELG